MNYKKQIELENSMVDLGISRLNKIRETNKKKGKESENDYSRGIIFCGLQKEKQVLRKKILFKRLELALAKQKI